MGERDVFNYRESLITIAHGNMLETVFAACV